MLNENFQALKKIVISLFHKNGLFKLKLVGKTYRVCYEAAHYREERDYPILKFLAKNKQCIFDVGANVGTSTLLLAEDNQASIYAFEPSEYAAKLIITNVVANGVQDRTTVVNTLVTDRSGSVLPFYWDYSSGGASIFAGRLGHNFLLNKTTISLDDYFKLNALTPDLIKVDVEGAEYLVLQGSLQLFQQIKPIVFLELHATSTMMLWENAQQIIDLLATVNYDMVYLRTKQIIRNAEILKERGRCHVLLQPAGHSYLPQLEQFDTHLL